MTLKIAVPDIVKDLAPGAGVDFERMRDDRLQRALQAMADDNLDVLMLGGNGNIHYISGARRLWQSGSGPYSPSGILVRESGEVYLLSTTTAGIPDEIPVKNLYPLSWNPANTLSFLSAIREVREARRIGVDGMSPFFAGLLSKAAPDAQFVSAEPAMRRARAIKSADEIQCLRIATRIAEQALDASREAVKAGVGVRELQAIAMQHMTEFGATIPGHEGLFAALPRDPATPLARLVTDDMLREGDHVALSPAVMYAGYEGSVGRTFICGKSDAQAAALTSLHNQWSEQWQALSVQLTPGGSFAEIQKILTAGHAADVVTSVNGVGIGMEAPLLHSAGAPLPSPLKQVESGMTLAIQTYICSAEAGGYYRADTIAITDDGYELLSAGD